MKRNRQVMYPSSVTKPKEGALAPQQKVGRNADGTRRDWRAGEPLMYLKGSPGNPRSPKYGGLRNGGTR